MVHEGDDYLEISRNLATVHLYNNDFEDAERCAMQALHGYQSANNDCHAIGALQTLFTVYEEQGQFGLAQGVNKVELDACIRFYGQSHQRTLLSRYSYSFTLLRDMKGEEALQQALLAFEHISQFHSSSSDTYAYWYGRFERLFSNFGEQDGA